MILARVLAPVVSTIKHEALKGRSIFVVQPVPPLLEGVSNDKQQSKGKTFLALDSVQACPGDIVLINREGNSCRQILKNELAPVNALITGIVDKVYGGFILMALVSSLIFSNANAFSIEANNPFQNDGVKFREFAEMTGLVSNFKALSPANPLGIWGFKGGLELTSIPPGTFQIFSNTVDLPPFFPRLHVVKGLTPNFDAEVSILFPKLLIGFSRALALPLEIKDLITYGGGLKYALFTEEEFPFSLAARITYNRLNVSFYRSDVFGADASISRSLTLPFLPLSFTPYIGAGYISIIGKFRKEKIPLGLNTDYKIQDYRYFAGLSTRFLIFNLTGQADFANPKRANTVSLKIGIDIF